MTYFSEQYRKVPFAGKNCFSQLILRHNSSAQIPRSDVFYFEEERGRIPHVPTTWRSDPTLGKKQTYQNWGKLSGSVSLSPPSRSLSVTFLRDAIVVEAYWGVFHLLSVVGLLPLFSDDTGWSFPLLLRVWCFLSECGFSDRVRGERGGGEATTADWVRTGGGGDWASLAS